MPGFFSRRPDNVSKESNSQYYARRAAELQAKKQNDHRAAPPRSPTRAPKKGTTEAYLDEVSQHTTKVWVDTFYDLADAVSDVFPTTDTKPTKTMSALGPPRPTYDGKLTTTPKKARSVHDHRGGSSAPSDPARTSTTEVDTANP